MRAGSLLSVALAAASLLLLPAVSLAWSPLDASSSYWHETLDWDLNSGGSSTLGSSTVISTLEAAYETWEDPACSDFSASRSGSTSRTSTSNGDGYNVHGFLSSWPAGYGDGSSTIGITLTSSWPSERKTRSSRFSLGQSSIAASSSAAGTAR